MYWVSRSRLAEGRTPQSSRGGMERCGNQDTRTVEEDGFLKHTTKRVGMLIKKQVLGRGWGMCVDDFCLQEPAVQTPYPWQRWRRCCAAACALPRVWCTSTGKPYCSPRKVMVVGGRRRVRRCDNPATASGRTSALSNKGRMVPLC